jgi:hypothetical protein
VANKLGECLCQSMYASLCPQEQIHYLKEKLTVSMQGWACGSAWAPPQIESARSGPRKNVWAKVRTKFRTIVRIPREIWMSRVLGYKLYKKFKTHGK